MVKGHGWKGSNPTTRSTTIILPSLKDSRRAITVRFHISSAKIKVENYRIIRQGKSAQRTWENLKGKNKVITFLILPAQKWEGYNKPMSIAPHLSGLFLETFHCKIPFEFIKGSIDSCEIMQ